MTISASLLDSLLRQLFTPGTQTFGILDGALNPGLLDLLAAFQPEHHCLWLGSLEPDMEAVAPYLVRLRPQDAFAEHLLKHGYGKRWGIYGHSDAPLLDLRRHFRRLTFVADETGKQSYFRYYDPSVLANVLSTGSAKQAAILFGPVSAFLCEVPEKAWPDSDDHHFRQFAAPPATTA